MGEKAEVSNDRSSLEARSPSWVGREGRMGILSSCEIDGEKRHEPSALIHGKSHEKSCAKEAEGNGKSKN
jgi:hypothetical protein